MLALEAWPALREKSDLFWGLVGTGAIAIWFFGRLGYFALVGIPRGWRRFADEARLVA